MPAQQALGCVWRHRKQAAPLATAAGLPPCAQASVGFVLPTLITWRAQLRAARRYAERRPGADADRQLAGSAYERVCAPVLELADLYGGAAVPTALAALLGYVAALLVREARSGD